MAEWERLHIEPGTITGYTPAKQALGTGAARWNVPLMTEEQRRNLLEALAEDVCFAGRWAGGDVTEEDRVRAGASERDWTPACDCGMKQPCRHAQTVLFEFRQGAKNEPWLWLKVRGADWDKTMGAVRKLRAAVVPGYSHTAESAIEETIAGRLHPPDDLEPGDSPLLAHMTNPAFWNRDIAFAKWLRPLYRAVGKEENDGIESDRALDTNLFERI